MPDPIQPSQGKQRAPMNRTLILDDQDIVRLSCQILQDLPSKPFSVPPTGTIRGDCLKVAKW